MALEKFSIQESVPEETKNKLKELREMLDIPNDPQSHIEEAEDYEQREESRSLQAEESGALAEEGEKKEVPPPLRWREMHAQFMKAVDENKKKSFEDLETIAWLENEIYEAEKFLEEIKEKGVYLRQSPAVRESEALIGENRKTIEEIKKANPYVEELWLKPRREEHQEEEAKKREEEDFKKLLAEEEEKEKKEKKKKAKSLKILLENLDAIKTSKESLDFGDIITALGQAEKGGYLEVYSAKDKKIEKIIKKPGQSWRYIRILKKVYMPSGKENSQKVFQSLKKIAQKVFQDDKERKSQERAAVQKANLPVKNIMDGHIEEGKACYLAIKTPVEVKGRKHFVRGGILFRTIKSKQGNVYWRVEEIVGNVAPLGVHAKSVFAPGFINATKPLKEVIQKIIDKTDEKEAKRP